MTFPTDDEAQAMTNDELLAQINGHDPYDVEFARRFRELEVRADHALSLVAEAYEVVARECEPLGLGPSICTLTPSDALAAREARDKRVRDEALKLARAGVWDGLFHDNPRLAQKAVDILCALVEGDQTDG